jgi:hypothetical protein
VYCYSQEVSEQKLAYIHQNPKAPATEKALDEAAEEAMKIIFDAQNVSRTVLEEQSETGLFLIKDFTIDTEVSGGNRKNIEDKFFDFEQKLRKKRLTKLLIAMVSFYFAPDEVKKHFQKDAILKGEQIVENIFLGMKDRKTDSVLIKECKDSIVKHVGELIDYLTSND